MPRAVGTHESIDAAPDPAQLDAPPRQNRWNRSGAVDEQGRPGSDLHADGQPDRRPELPDSLADLGVWLPPAGEDGIDAQAQRQKEARPWRRGRNWIFRR